ncbi:MAG: hypothetical protein LBQ89_09490 [Treponema sp.]|jgi:tetratricopeptide (TPR) repeat protein|nr:hypothetical protein [Treponema sp.]
MKVRVKLLITFLLIVPAFVQAQIRPPDALAEYRAGNYERSIQICRDEITENPYNIESYVVICWSLIRLNRYEEALRSAQTGRALNRADVRIIEIMGEIYYFQGHNAEALSFFQEYASLAPEGQRIDMVYYYIGEIYIRQGKFRHADISLTTAVQWAPGNSSWWVRLAYARENAANMRSAQEAYERARDMNSALEAYERALSLNPQMTDAQRGMERIRRSMGGQ